MNLQNLQTKKSSNFKKSLSKISHQFSIKIKKLKKVCKTKLENKIKSPHSVKEKLKTIIFNLVIRKKIKFIEI